MTREALLMVAASERDADMLYAVGFFVPDPFIYLRLDGRAEVVMNDLEIDRARKYATQCRVVSLGGLIKKLPEQARIGTSLASVIRELLQQRGIKRVSVPPQFPAGLVERLKREKIRVDVREQDVFPERQFKSPDEVKKISAALTMAEVGLSEAIQVLKHAKIARDRKLYYRSSPLTAEKLRSVIDIAIVQAGGVATHTIVAGGSQACDPHERGYGALKAHEPIVLDVFPRSQKTGYFGDITRTVVKGRASEAVRKLYYTVERGQSLAKSKIRQGMPAAKVHEEVQGFFQREGYRTGKKGGRMEGFFHGTGHGLGLEIHESPRVSGTSRDILRTGHVVTVEPGLYYPGVGGVRLEDVVLVTQRASRNLTRFEKVLEV